MQVSIASAPHPPYPRKKKEDRWITASEFQSHLRPIHPIHERNIRIFYPLSCKFQSHLRPIHPIHPPRRDCWYLDLQVSIASAPHSPYPLAAGVIAATWPLLFQSHLRPIHPIHGPTRSMIHDQANSFNRICAPFTLSTPNPPMDICIMLGFNRICAPSTLSTLEHCRAVLDRIVSIASAPHPPYPLGHWNKLIGILSQMFQSHLRPIHPIHSGLILLPPSNCKSFNRICAPSTLSTEDEDVQIVGTSCVSIASAPHPPYPRVQGVKNRYKKSRVSIASAPHPPYPLLYSEDLHMPLDGFNRICAPSTLSTKWFPERIITIKMFQSHLRPIHPIHGLAYNAACRAQTSFNRICAPSTLSTCVKPHGTGPCFPVSIASAPHPPYPPP